MRARRSHSVSFAIMVPLISIMLFSSTIVPVLPSAIIPPSPSLLSIQEAFAQDGDEEPESQSSEEPTDGSTDGSTDDEPGDGSTDDEPGDGSTDDEPRRCDPPEVPCDDGTEPPPEPTECPEDQVLEDGECVDVDPPEPPNCPEGQVLQDGVCVVIIDCEEGQILQDGKCVEPPTRCDPACIPPTPTTPPPAPTNPAPTNSTSTNPAPTNPVPTNPGGVIQQPGAAPANTCEVWNIDGQGQTESTGTAAPPPTGTCPKIELILSTNSIRPEIGETLFTNIIAVGDAPPAHTQRHINGGTVDITVRVRGLPDNSNIPVTLDFKPQRGTGGHSHISGGADDTTKRAFGRFIGPGVDNNNPLKVIGKTDSSGQMKVTFRAENLISDYSSASGILEFTATATLQGKLTVSSPKTLTIEIPGLQSLPRGITHATHGDNTGHHGGNNHYGTPAVILAIQNIAKEYARTHNGDLLNIGEISLPMGGVFDFWADWNPAESNDRHKAHACGTDVDVHVLASNGKRIQPIDLATITRLQFPGAFVTTEGDHYHIHFGDCLLTSGEECSTSKTTIQEIADTSYSINANTLKGVTDQFKYVDPKTGEKYGAETVADYQILEIKHDDTGRISCIVIKIYFKTDYPVWSNVGAIPGELGKCFVETWQYYLEMARVHEERQHEIDGGQDHESIILKNYKDIHKRYIGKTDQEKNKEEAKIKQEIQRIHDNYDTRTHHGANVGAYIRGDECR